MDTIALRRAYAAERPRRGVQLRPAQNDEDPGIQQRLSAMRAQEARSLGIGEAPGGYALIDLDHNLLDVWHDHTEQEAIDRFNKMEKPAKFADNQIWLIGIANNGGSLGVLGVK